jgi:hypothetical protein
MGWGIQVTNLSFTSKRRHLKEALRLVLTYIPPSDGSGPLRLVFFITPQIRTLTENLRWYRPAGVNLGVDITNRRLGL